MTTTTIRPTFELDGTTYSYNAGNHQYFIDTKIDGLSVHKKISKADYEIALATFNNPPAPKADPTPEDAPKTKTHPTADAFLEKIPADTYIFRTNKKGHILISKVEGDKTAYARIRPLKDGAYIFPGKELKATRDDWEFHEGWANEYALKVANWDEVAEVLNLTQA